MIIKAITLTQPWATLVALGYKQVETRSWRTDYRGPLVIHAAKSFPRWARDTMIEDLHFAAALQGFTANDLPRGAALCVVELLGCVPVTESPVWAEKVNFSLGHKMSVSEIYFGDYAPDGGRYAWPMRLIEVFAEPIPCSGALGLWDWYK